jgi:hypothetical protein
VRSNANVKASNFWVVPSQMNRQRRLDRRSNSVRVPGAGAAVDAVRRKDEVRIGKLVLARHLVLEALPYAQLSRRVPAAG